MRLLVDEMEKAGIIRRSMSPWAFPAFVIKKTDGTYRIVVDYRTLNAVTVPDAFPLPDIPDILQSLSRHRLYTKVDAPRAFHQVRVASSDIPKTAFCTPDGIFEYLGMSLGLKNAPATFQRLMSEIFQDMINQSCMIFIDDLLQWGDSFDDYERNLRALLERYRKFNVKLKASKCAFLKTSVKALGHYVGHQSIRTDPEKTSAISAMEYPRNVKEVQRFLGAAGYYADFIPRFGHYAYPLYKLVKKDAPWTFGHTEKVAVDYLKEALTKAPVVLSPPLPGYPFELQTDASGVAMSGVLHQIIDGRRRVIAYGSKLFNPAQRNYSVTDRELLAIVHFVNKWRQYLDCDQMSTVVTDHSACKWLIDARNGRPIGMHARWLVKLSAFPLRFEHRPGTRIPVPDGLTREPFVREELPQPRVQLCWKPLRHATWIPRKPALPTAFLTAECDLQLIDVDASGGERAQEEASYLNSKYVFLSTDSPLLAAEEGQETDESSSSSSSESTSSSSSSSDDSENPQTALEAQKAIDLHNNRARALLEDIAPSALDVSEDLNLEKVSDMQRTDKHLKHLWALFHDQTELPTEIKDPELRVLVELKDSMFFDGSLLWLHWFPDAEGVSPGPRLRLLVPIKLRRPVLTSLHQSEFAGHPGISRTYALARERYYWPGMKADIEKWVKGCAQCQVTKLSKVHRQRTLRSTVGISAPFQRVAVDLVGKMSTTDEGHEYILTIVDYLTRFAICVPLKRITTKDIASALLEHLICQHGCPLEIISDQGSQFNSVVAQAFYDVTKIKKIQTTAWRPQGNGLDERFNGTIQAMLRSYTSVYKNNWHQFLPILTFAYNTTPQTSLQSSPFKLLFGREALRPFDVLVGHGVTIDLAEDETPETWAEYLPWRLAEARQFALDHLARAQLVQQKYYNRQGKLYELKPGTVVKLRREPDLNQEGSDRVLREYESGWVVVSYLGNDVYRIANPSQAMKVVNVDKLLPLPQETAVRTVDTFPTSSADQKRLLQYEEKKRAAEKSAITGADRAPPTSSSSSSSSSVPQAAAKPAVRAGKRIFTKTALVPAPAAKKVAAAPKPKLPYILQNLKDNLYNMSKKHILFAMDSVYPGSYTSLDQMTLIALRPYLAKVLSDLENGIPVKVVGAGKSV
eukprot:TRINITY_DN357_c0_g4_i1.p2 TRINITY_DN357_c0_g4~~TRINITY_DN357_c0_g4_i1.p2  ORF type:complete len:1143 (+),score=204.96 TRINITY_DN357_c0_g4_i1:5195-8623(+)